MPDWDRHGRAAQFRRNDELRNFPPKGVIAFPSSGGRIPDAGEHRDALASHGLEMCAELGRVYKASGWTRVGTT